MDAENKHLELRQILKKTLPHKARCDTISPREQLDSTLRPVAPLFGLDGSNKSGTTQCRQFRWMAFRLRCGECFHWRCACVVIEDAGQCRIEDALAIRTGAVSEEHCMISGNPS